METLATHFGQGEFTYDQIEREAEFAIYSQTHTASGIIRYEGIRIRIRRSHTWPNGSTTDEHEAYPSPESWGRDGFTFYTLAAAQAHLHRLAQDKT